MPGISPLIPPAPCRAAHVSPCPPAPEAILGGRAVSCMVCLPRQGPRARGSSRNMQAAGPRPGLLSNVVERDYTSWARRPTLPCATRTEPRESDFSGYPRWVEVLNRRSPLHPPPNPPLAPSAATISSAERGTRCARSRPRGVGTPRQQAGEKEKTKENAKAAAPEPPSHPPGATTAARGKRDRALARRGIYRAGGGRG